MPALARMKTAFSWKLPLKTDYHAYGCLRACISIVDIFSQDVIVDEVSITLAGQDSNRLKFVAQVDKLSPGDNCLTLYCAVGHPPDVCFEIVEQNLIDDMLRYVCP